MDKIEKKIKLLLTFGGWILSLVVGLWSLFGIYFNLKTELQTIQKMTLRNTIWNENIPMHDRLEGCDIYLESGFNSETKKYCDILLTKENFK